MWNEREYEFDKQYIVCDEENLEMFKRLCNQTNTSDYNLESIFERMKYREDPASEEEKGIYQDYGIKRVQNKK